MGGKPTWSQCLSEERRHLLLQGKDFDQSYWPPHPNASVRAPWYTCRGHSGYEKTLHKLKRVVHWKGLRSSVKKYVRECDTWQRNKNENTSPACLLQPYPFQNKFGKKSQWISLRGWPRVWEKQLYWWLLTGSPSLGISFLYLILSQPKRLQQPSLSMFTDCTECPKLWCLIGMDCSQVDSGKNCGIYMDKQHFSTSFHPPNWWANGGDQHKFRNLFEMLLLPQTD